ncbi:MAG: ABC transporter substrate-binding protein [Thermomicrobiales bacterium]
MRTRRVLSRRQFLEMSSVAAAGAAFDSSINGPSAIAAPFAAQSGTPAAADVRPGGTLNYAEAGDFEDFNPWGFSAVNMGIYNQVFSRLLWKDTDGQIQPDIAEAWQLSDDNLTLTLNLRQGVMWHDGRECTAEDVVTMFGFLQDEALAEYSGVSKIQGLLEPITEVRAVDTYTLELIVAAAVPYLTDILDYWYVIRIDDKADPEMVQSLPIGTGPFTLAEWEPAQFVRLPKFADYYQADRPYLDEIMFRRLDRAETLVPNLQSGTISGVQLTASGDVAPLQEDDNYTVEVVDAGSIFNIIVNVNKPPFDQIEVRQALSYSLNREGMAQTAFFGVSTPIASPFFSPASLAYREDLVLAHPFDLDMAASLLEQAGANDLEMTIHVTPVWPQMKLFCLIWQADLQQIGVTLTVNEVEAAQFYDIGGAPDLLGHDLHPWLVGRTTRDPALFFSTQTIYRGGESNRFGYVNPELEELVAQGAVEVDEERRREIYQQLNELVVNSCHIIQVATDPRVWVFENTAQGMHWDLSGNFFADTIWLDQS